MRERNIENEILKQNKIPGCDQLTKPEEIKALSKYLRSIKKVQENHTSLEKNNLEIPGRTTGRIPNINSLEDHVEELDGVSRINRLYGEGSRISLNDNPVSSLYTAENSREELKDRRETFLEDKREDLIKSPTDIQKLNDNKENLNISSSEEKEELGNERLKLQNVRGVKNLYINTKEKLDVPEDNVELSDSREILTDSRDIELGQTRINLKGFSNLSYKEQLELDSINELDTTRIDLDNKKDPQELETYREDLRKIPEEDTKLSNHKSHLRIEDDLKDLKYTREELRESQSQDITELSRTRLTLNTTAEDQELETYRENLGYVSKELDSLGDYKEKLRKEEDSLKELPKDRTALTKTAEDLKNLKDTKINLEKKPEDLELEDYRENLGVEDNNSLEDTRIGLNNTDSYEISELEDTRVGLDNTGDSIVDLLEDTRIDLGKKPEDLELEDYRENLEVEDNNSLEDTRIDLVGDISGTSELEDYIDKLGNTQESRIKDLEDTRIDLEKKPEDQELEDYRENLEVEEDNSSLRDTRIDLVGDISETSELEDYIDKLEDDRDSELGDKKIELPSISNSEFEGHTPLTPGELDSLGGNINNFYESILEIPDSTDAPRQDGDYTPLGPEELDNLEGNFYDSVLEIPEDIEENHIIEELEDTSVEIPEDIEENRNIELEDTSIEIPEGLDDNHIIDKLANTKQKTPKSQPPKGQESYRYLENQELSTKIIDGLPYKNHETSGDTIRSKAERGENGALNIGGALGKLIDGADDDPRGKHGKDRQKALDICLDNLVSERDAKEIVKGTWRSRLPGNNSGAIGDLVSGGLKGMFNGIVDSAVSSVKKNVGNVIAKDSNFMEIDISNPLNRPDSLLDKGVDKGIDLVKDLFSKDKDGDDKKKKEDGWTSANNRITSSMPDSADTYTSSSFSELEKKYHIKVVNGKTGNSSESGEKKFWKDVGKIAKNVLSDSLLGSDKDYKLKNNYLSGEGSKITLEELCGKSQSEVTTLSDLYDALKQSPFITTPDKFGSTGYSGYKAQTLDNNAYWEIVLEPYVGSENGSLNYLPGIHEINIRNIRNHGVNTAYNKWIPFTSFDLQKSKLTTKTLSLYDGEISYPISMEFTNELRITIADDQYKSWRTYFEECAKAAIYNSEGHTSQDYYRKPKEATLTAIDTGNICIAMYKNICFRCTIYVMTPQYSTIKKFDLLIVLKDFSEESSGDIGDGAGDLTLSFSVVGENPKPENSSLTSYYRTLDEKEKKIPKKRKTSSDYTSILSGGINAVGGLIK